MYYVCSRVFLLNWIHIAYVICSKAHVRLSETDDYLFVSGQHQNPLHVQIVNTTHYSWFFFFIRNEKVNDNAIYYLYINKQYEKKK